MYTSGWLRFGSWLVKNRNYAGRLPVATGEGSFLVGLARSRFGLSMASSGVTASRKKYFDRRNLSPRKGGARFYVVNGMPSEATQELGGRTSPTVMDGVYTKTRPEEVAPEMRAAADKACRGLEVERFVGDLDHEVCAEASEMLGSERGDEVRVWRHQFRSVKDLLAPAVAFPIKENLR